jgi:hypothetical protein
LQQSGLACAVLVDPAGAYDPRLSNHRLPLRLLGATSEYELSMRWMGVKYSLRKPAWPEALLLGVCAAVCSIQIFVPPYIGLANNGDFPKVYRRFACAPPDGDARNFIYFVANC